MATYTTPENAEVNEFSLDIAKQTHTLIGGATRSGKSVLLNSFVVDMLKVNLPLLDTEDKADRQCGFFFIDPKRGVEFGRYRNLPHTLGFATDSISAVDVLQDANNLMDARYDELTATGKRKYNGKHVYVIIDEYADISSNKQVSALVERIARLGGAANIHAIISTQQPLITSGAITSACKANLTAQIALRCEEPKDSRAIIRQAGAELLPLNGFCLYRTPYSADIKKIPVPFTEDSEIDELVSFWLAQQAQPETHRKAVKEPETVSAVYEPTKHQGKLLKAFAWLTGINITITY